MILRPGRDADAEGFVALVGRCWSDYPGCVLDTEHEERALLAFASHVAARGGALWTAEDGGDVVGMAAVLPGADGAWELEKLYVHPDHHGAGLGHRLLDAAEAHAIAAGAVRLTLWTDTRFLRAHRFYEKRSWVRTGPVRALDDRSGTLEYAYGKPVDGVQPLGAAAAASAAPRLASILAACVDAGASVSYLAPIDPAAARAEMDKAARQVAEGASLLFGGWVGGVLCGTVRLDLAWQPNQPHRAEIAKLLVLPAARGHGLAARLMQAAEAAAHVAGRTLLTLDTRADDAGERLYRRLGWIEAGRIPGFSVDAFGAPEATVIFYKTVSPGRATPDGVTSLRADP